MKVSELTIEKVASYIRADIDDETQEILSVCLAGAISYCSTYTGLSVEALDEYSDMPLAVLALCSEFYDLRQFTVSEMNNVNQTTTQILNSYSSNLI